MFKKFILNHRRQMASGEGKGQNSERVRQWLRRSGCLTFKREPIARGIGIGLFVGLTPTVGLQTIMMLAGSLLVRGNFPAAFAISWVSNPFTLPPMVYAYHELGKWLFGSWAQALFKGSDAVDNALIAVVSTVLGTLLIAIPIALVGYFASLGISEVWHRRRHQAREKRRQAARRERES
ncbi:MULTISPECIES: DUF2062 domain-containing protein [unclassified Wenzhouxiangella]|uniref:DUF2062 domain-containing protein n=1 Tax=unclassified Wenzhouxiangella TaxID=2613841 RepID=UPI000E32D0DB|nr:MULTISPECIES: DUF2062 domain-containing protein [unclassified Wenzhouxiangella]RFF27264.1 DUF2062 domain-containing protein [Wenzhouxiangella sp. 15181]RFP69278.1 DUF2062 domain-containing protein [Wenzhouxiangella sp. 15190]